MTASIIILYIASSNLNKESATYALIMLAILFLGGFGYLLYYLEQRHRKWNKLLENAKKNKLN